MPEGWDFGVWGTAIWDGSNIALASPRLNDNLPLRKRNRKKRIMSIPIQLLLLFREYLTVKGANL